MIVFLCDFLLKKILKKTPNFFNVFLSIFYARVGYIVRHYIVFMRINRSPSINIREKLRIHFDKPIPSKGSIGNDPMQVNFPIVRLLLISVALRSS